MSVGARLLIALPWVLGLALVGAVVGGSLDDSQNGFRVGAVLGGVGAYLHIRRKMRSAD